MSDCLAQYSLLDGMAVFYAHYNGQPAQQDGRADASDPIHLLLAAKWIRQGRCRRGGNHIVEIVRNLAGAKE